jgi:hypothetical protein
MAEQKIVRKVVDPNNYSIAYNLKNLGKIRGEIMSVETTSTDNNPTGPQERSYQRIFSLVSFVTGLARSIGLFILGIFLGLGIVLRDPPPDRKNIAIIEKLQSENDSLKLSLKNKDESSTPSFGEIKNSIVIKP